MSEGELIATATGLPPLSVRERKRLTELESVIVKGLGTFIQVGLALREIRDKNLYRQDHETFELYCKRIFDMGKTYAYYQIEGAQVVQNLIECGYGNPQPEGDVIEIDSQGFTIVDKLVSESGSLIINEAQARELARIKDPEIQVQVWRKAVAESKGRPTARIIRGLIRDLEEGEVKARTRKVREFVDHSREVTPEFREKYMALYQVIFDHREAGWKNGLSKAAVLYTLETLRIAVEGEL